MDGPCLPCRAWRNKIMVFPVSGVEVNPVIPFAVAFIVSFFTSMGGVSGAFLLLPFQVSFLGYTAPSVSATNQVFNIVAIPSGVYRFIKEGRMLWPLTWAVIIGTLPGVFIGAWVRIEYLPDPKNFKAFVGCILLYIGIKLVQDVMKNKEAAVSQKDNNSKVRDTFIVSITRSSLKRVEFSFDDKSFSYAPSLVLGICFLVGIAGGIYGIGGGSIVAPFFVAILGLPVYAVAGAALMGTFITSVAGVAFYQVLAIFYTEMSVAPDWMLGFLLGFGGFVGIYLGARCQKYVPARLIKLVLCICVMVVAARYLMGFFQ